MRAMKRKIKEGREGRGGFGEISGDALATTNSGDGWSRTILITVLRLRLRFPSPVCRATIPLLTLQLLCYRKKYHARPVSPRHRNEPIFGDAS